VLLLAGALLCAARLAEVEQTKQALLLLHALTRTQAVGTAEERVEAAVEAVVQNGGGGRRRKGSGGGSGRSSSSSGDGGGEASRRERAAAAAAAAAGSSSSSSSSSSAAAPRGGETTTNDGSWEVNELIRESRRVLRTWSVLHGLEECYISDDWREGPLPLLVSMGVVEVVGSRGGGGGGSSRGGGGGGEVRVRLRPLEEAVDTAREIWRVLAVSDHGGIQLPEGGEGGGGAAKQEEEGEEAMRRVRQLQDAFSGGGHGEGQRAAQAAAAVGGGTPVS